MKDQTKTKTETKYEVTFGQKKVRETKTFTEQDKALDFFAAKDKDGFHVDAYEIQVTTKKTKLSK